MALNELSTNINVQPSLTKEQILSELNRRGKNTDGTTESVQPSLTKEQILSELDRREQAQSTQDEAVDDSFLGQTGDVLKGVARPIARTGRILASGTLGTAVELANLAVNPFAEALGADRLAESTRPGAATETIKAGFDVLTGGLGQPQTEQEEVLDTAGEFASSLLGGGVIAAGAKALGVASKGINLAVKFLGAESMAEIIGAGAAGAASEKLRQNDVEGLANVLGTLGSGVLATGLSGVAVKAAKPLIKSIGSGFDIALDAFGFQPALTENLLKVPEKDLINIMSTPKEIRFQNLKTLSEQQGIQLPLSVLTENNIIKGTESFLSGTALAGNFYSKMSAKINNKFLNNYNDILDNISKTTYETAFEAGEAGLSQLKQNRELASQKYNVLYDRAFQSIPEAETTNWKNTTKVIDDVISKLSKREIKSPETRQTIENLTDLQKSLTLTGGELPVQNLIETKISLNELIDFERVGTTKGLLKGVLKGVHKDIDKYAKTNQEFASNYKRANDLFGDAANRLRSDVSSSLLKQDRPEYVLSKMNNVSNVRKIGSALSMNSDGAKVFDSLKRQKLKTLLTDKFINKATDEFSIRRASTALSQNQSNNELIRELLGPDNFKKVNNLQNLSSEIVKSFDKFANKSGSAFRAAEIGAMGSMVSGIVSGNLGLIGVPMVPYAAASLLTNPRFINVAAKTLNAAKKGNMRAFNKSRLTLLSIVDEEKKKNEAG